MDWDRQMWWLGLKQIFGHLLVFIFWNALTIESLQSVAQISFFRRSLGDECLLLIV
jgi:hypothetical protein